VATAGAAGERRTPDWARDVVWYQIFPERFRDGDPSNNPGRGSLEWPIVPSERWRISPWTADWYARDAWETELDKAADLDPSPAFYKAGVFDRRYGGDLQGVIDKLDYLKELGVTAIYFNPVFYARSMHKYDGNSFHHIDPYFGPDPKGDFAIMDTETADPATWKWTSADKLFLDLLQQAKTRGMRVIIDGVFNHTGRDFFAFADLRKNQEKSPYREWYQVESFDRSDTTRNEFFYRGWWGHKTLPIFAATPDGKDMASGPKKYVFDITRRWMDPDGDGDPSDGIDGWRLDVADERPAKFWADWNALVQSINPEAYTTGEVWGNPLEMIAHGGFSATMNYYGFAMPLTGFFIDENLSASRFAAMMDERRNALPPGTADVMQNLMDSHDTDRVASMVVNGHNHGNPDHLDFNNASNARASSGYQIRRPDGRERAIQRMIALFQMTYVGAPMIYYGTEAGMWGGNDPDDRMPMVWEDLHHEPQAIDPRGHPRPPDDIGFDKELFTFYRTAIGLRRQYPALRRGDYRLLGAFDDQKTLAFVRKDSGSALVVAFNRSGSPQTVSFDLEPDEAARLAEAREVFNSIGYSGGVECKLDGRRMTLSLPSLTGAVFSKF
jgi:glycosidase